VEEVTVTGSRVIRDGSNAPTPLSVVGLEDIQKSAGGNIATLLTTLPVFSLSISPNSNNTNSAPSGGLTGLNLVNLRGLGPNRTLVLIDGQRFVPTLTFGSVSTSAVDISALPQQLIKRIDTVTGGASAVYGSDAVGGVVNFILDKTFTGMKVDGSFGETSYGDDKSTKLDITLGAPFAGDRGHILFSGEISSRDQLTDSSNRAWAKSAYCVMTNPNYTATNGQPLKITVANCGENSAPGGVINTGPLKGTTFGVGGVPLPFQYGPLVSTPSMSGGSYHLAADEVLTRGNALDPGEHRQNAFALVSYDLTDKIKVTFTSAWSHTGSDTQTVPAFYDSAPLTIASNNAFIPLSLRPALVGTPSFILSTLNADIPPISTYNKRYVARQALDFAGDFNLLKTDWKWDAYYQHGETRNSLNATAPSRTRYAAATAAVLSANGTIVCANGDPACVPFNVFGIGVNSPAALAYVEGLGHVLQKNTQDVFAGSITGEPFSTWAGPVGLAFSAEHRKEEASGVSNAEALSKTLFSGNYQPVNGKFDVTEAALEAAVPLAHNLPLADSWDLQLAVRETHYSTSGNVTTWKVGSTYSPVSDVKFRGNISHDIRAGNLGELYAPAGAPIPTPIFQDLLTNTSQSIRTSSSGNPNVKPEEADAQGFGVVVQPHFLPGLTMSLDYWKVQVNGEIAALTAPQAMQLCFSGNQGACGFITRTGPATIPGAAGTPYAGQLFAPISTIVTGYINIATARTSGLDLSVAYRFPLSSILPFDGDVALRWDETYYYKGVTKNGLPGGLPLNIPSYWLGVASADYKNKDWSFGVDARYTSLDPFIASFMGGTLSCGYTCPPASTLPANITTYNFLYHKPSLYFDANLSRNLVIAGADAQFYVNIRNLFNKDPVLEPPAAQVFSISQSQVGDNALGRIFRIGLRFRR
jgi:outer membrane receptor protein involved in Fe transport